jgi:hypothetical protein
MPPARRRRLRLKPGSEVDIGRAAGGERRIGEVRHAASEAVWPWLVQVGFGKAGFYSNDLLGNAAHLSADRITDELQHPQVGD